MRLVLLQGTPLPRLECSNRTVGAQESTLSCLSHHKVLSCAGWGLGGGSLRSVLPRGPWPGSVPPRLQRLYWGTGSLGGTPRKWAHLAKVSPRQEGAG